MLKIIFGYTKNVNHVQVKISEGKKKKKKILDGSIATLNINSLSDISYLRKRRIIVSLFVKRSFRHSSGTRSNFWTRFNLREHFFGLFVHVIKIKRRLDREKFAIDLVSRDIFKKIEKGFNTFVD